MKNLLFFHSSLLRGLREFESFTADRLREGGSPRHPLTQPLPRERSKKLLAAVLISLLAGCDPAPPQTPRVPVSTLHGTGVIHGKVIFDGPKPPEKLVRNSPCCPGAPAMQRDETVTVNDNGTLANCFVYLEGGPRTDGSALPPPTLDQLFCQYVPHVVGVVVNQPLTIHSSDPTIHNVNIKPYIDPAMNFYMQKAGDHSTAVFHSPQFVKSVCDVHPWMNAWIGVFDNPYFAVTGSDGTFEIKNVPAGDYTLVAWHERFGKLSQPITIKDGSPVDINFTYKPPN